MSSTVKAIETRGWGEMAGLSGVDDREVQIDWSLLRCLQLFEASASKDEK